MNGLTKEEVGIWEKEIEDEIALELAKTEEGKSELKEYSSEDWERLGDGTENGELPNWIECADSDYFCKAVLD